MPPHFLLNYFDPPVGLERHVLALFHFVWDETSIEERHPGALPQIVLFPHGTGEMEFMAGRQTVTSEAHMLSTFTVAPAYRVEGPWHAVGASLSPLGWAALTGRPASDYLDRFAPASELLGDGIESFARATNDAYRNGEIDGREACDRLAQWIAPRLAAVPPAHEALIEKAIGWLASSLSPEVDDLFAELNYSRRQAERLIERYFGFPPAALARKFRAVRAAGLLSQEQLSAEAEAEIAEAFHDQPHMIREIRRYCGMTPTRLGGESGSLFRTMLKMKNFDRLSRFKAAD